MAITNWIAIAVGKTGIIAKGRKFYTAPGEDQIELAPDFLSEEDAKSRIFELNGTSYYMCIETVRLLSFWYSSLLQS